MAEQITIAGDRGRLIISILGYERLQREEEADPEWLACEVDCVVGPYQAKVNLSLATEDLIRFTSSLKSVIDNFHGTAILDTIEGKIESRIEMTHRGTAVVVGRISYYSGPEATLTFNFESDQSYLQQTLSNLKIAVSAFPDRLPLRKAIS